MAFNYPALQQLASGLISQFGQTAILRRGSSEDREVTAVEITEQPDSRDGALVASTSRRYLIAATGLTVPPDSELDSLVVEEGTLRIVWSKPLKPAGVAVYFEVETRL